MPLDKLAHGRIVIHDQDQGFFCLLLHRMSGLPASLPACFDHERLIALRDSRQPNCKRRSTARLALDRDVASHHLAKAFADRAASDSMVLATPSMSVASGKSSSCSSIRP